MKTRVIKALTILGMAASLLAAAGPAAAQEGEGPDPWALSCGYPDGGTADDAIITVVPTFVDGYVGDEPSYLSFQLYDLDGNLIDVPIGDSPLPGSNPLAVFEGDFPLSFTFTGPYSKLEVLYEAPLGKGSFEEFPDEVTCTAPPPAPTPTFTPTPTNTPTETPTPTPTNTPEPTSTGTVSPTNTPSPTREPETVPTIAPTATPKPPVQLPNTGSGSDKNSGVPLILALLGATSVVTCLRLALRRTSSGR